jgi:hypothetical protein
MRSFDCPEGGRCIDARCTRGRCVRGEIVMAAAAAQRARRPNSEYEEASDQIIRAFSISWD